MGANWKPLEAKRRGPVCRLHVHRPIEWIYRYKHGISRRYLFLDDEGRAYESAERNEFREIAFEEALGRVEEPLGALGATLETPYDAAYVRRKAAALRGAGIETLRIFIEPEDRTI